MLNVTVIEIFPISPPDIKPRPGPDRSVIPWSRTVGLCRRLSAVLLVILTLRTPGLTFASTTGSAREKQERRHDRKRGTTRQDITGMDMDTDPIILLLASDPWLDFHMHQVGWTLTIPQTKREIKLMT